MTEKHELYNYSVLGEFNHLFYKDLITENHCGEESFLVSPDGDKKFFYPLRYKKKVFALESDKIGKLPIRVKEAFKIGHRTNVYHWVERFSSAVIKGEKTMTLKALITDFAPFESNHSNPIHWFLYKVIILSLLNEKGFVRMATEAGFGKTSPFSMLNPLTNQTISINPRSAAAFEYRLIYKLINLDELTNLEKTQRNIMQDALLKVADWSPNYQKGTRGNKKLGTVDDMDITDTSIIITYNTTDHYGGSKQLEQYFDKIFQDAVHTRFLPLRMSGVLNAEIFIDMKNPKQTAKDNYDYYLDIIKNIKYYKEHINEELHGYKLKRKYVFQDKKTGRHGKTFNKILMYLDALSETEEEYNNYAEELYKCHTAYNKMIYDAFDFQSNEVREVKTGKVLTSVSEDGNN